MPPPRPPMLPKLARGRTEFLLLGLPPPGLLLPGLLPPGLLPPGLPPYLSLGLPPPGLPPPGLPPPGLPPPGLPPPSLPPHLLRLRLALTTETPLAIAPVQPLHVPAPQAEPPSVIAQLLCGQHIGASHPIAGQPA